MVNLHTLDRFRRTDPDVVAFFGSSGNAKVGVFTIPSPADLQPMNVIAGAGAGWDHVSVSRLDRIPTWTEMEHVKRLFFLPDETAMQLHVPPAEHINHNPFCLHLWRPLGVEIPRPPSWMVGPRPGQSLTGHRREAAQAMAREERA